jgi:hypothetical protein
VSFDTALWRGFDRPFVEAIASALAAPMNADVATVTIANANDRPVLAFSIHDGTVEHIILADIAGVNVHRRIDGELIGQDLTLTEPGAGEVRAACHALFHRIQARGGFQKAQAPTH